MSTILTTTAQKGTMPRMASAAGLCLAMVVVGGQGQGQFVTAKRFESAVASIATDLSTLNPWQPSSYRHAKPEEGTRGG